jgi:hypothetical protein
MNTERYRPSFGPGMRGSMYRTGVENEALFGPRCIDGGRGAAGIFEVIRKST